MVVCLRNVRVARPSPRPPIGHSPCTCSLSCAYLPDREGSVVRGAHRAPPLSLSPASRCAPPSPAWRTITAGTATVIISSLLNSLGPALPTRPPPPQFPVSRAVLRAASRTTAKVKTPRGSSQKCGLTKHATGTGAAGNAELALHHKRGRAQLRAGGRKSGMVFPSTGSVPAVWRLDLGSTPSLRGQRDPLPLGNEDEKVCLRH